MEKLFAETVVLGVIITETFCCSEYPELVASTKCSYVAGPVPLGIVRGKLFVVGDVFAVNASQLLIKEEHTRLIEELSGGVKLKLTVPLKGN